MPGQHVLDPAPVDVAVDLGGVVGGPGDVVLDQGAPLEQGDLGDLRAHVHADHVAADRLAPALAAAPPALGLGRGTGRGAGRRRHRQGRQAAAGTVRRSGARPSPRPVPEPSGRRAGAVVPVPPCGGPAPVRWRVAVPGGSGTGRAGRLSPIFGRSGAGRGGAGGCRAGGCRAGLLGGGRWPLRTLRHQQAPPGCRRRGRGPADEDLPRPPREPRRRRLGDRAPFWSPPSGPTAPPSLPSAPPSWPTASPWRPVAPASAAAPPEVGPSPRVPLAEGGGPVLLDVTGVAVRGGSGDSAGTSTGCPVAPSDIDIPFRNFS